MDKPPFTFIANWKMQKTFNVSLQFLAEHEQELSQLIHKTNTQLILCPSFLALPPFSSMLKNSLLWLGAQNCSSYDKGPYTGQIDAASLAQLNCQYCIIGHSEQRRYFHETNNDIAQKVVQLTTHNVTPIVCIGETEEDYKSNHTKQILYEQLLPIIKITTIKTLYIAYEPIWAIGTGKTATPNYIENITSTIKEWIAPYEFSKNTTVIYGGSIDEKNIASIALIQAIGGVLIGSASLDFKKLKNIVLLHKQP